MVRGHGRFKDINQLNELIAQQQQRKASLPQTVFKQITYTNNDSKYVQQHQSNVNKAKSDRDNFFKQQEELHQKINSDYRESEEGARFLHYKAVIKVFNKYFGENQTKLIPFFRQFNDTKKVADMYGKIDAMKKVMNNTLYKYLQANYDYTGENTEDAIFSAIREAEKQNGYQVRIFVNSKKPTEVAFEWNGEKSRKKYVSIMQFLKKEFDIDVSEYDIKTLEEYLQKVIDSKQYDLEFTDNGLTYRKVKSASEQINDALPFLKPMNDVLNIVAQPVFGVDANEATNMGADLGSQIGKGKNKNLKKVYMKKSELKREIKL